MMPTFSYRAYDKSGSLVSGKVSGESRETALETLRRRGTFAVEIAEAGTGADEAGRIRGRGERAIPWWEMEIGGPRRASPEVLELITRELAILLAAKLPLEDTLRILAVQPMMPARSRRVISDLVERVVSGSALSEAVGAHPEVFPDYYCRLIAAGERSGSLETVLSALAGFLERAAGIRTRITTALAYPVFLLVAAFATLALIVGVLVPAIAPMFADAGADPPPVIAVLLGAQSFLASHWPILLVSLAALLVLVPAASRLPAIAAWRSRVALGLPVIGRLIAARETARFAGTLAMLMQGGVPLLEATETAADTLINVAYRNAALSAREQLARGVALSQSLADSGIFSPLAARLTAVGEKTGQLGEMLARLSAIEEASLQRDMDRLATFIAPALTLIIGVVVGAIILSVMGAIISLNDLALQ
ncbi:MAG: type II secretion system F family protein [Alphaproteobacteria bacterium]|nr:type II secretion system F family protein [Alphaproteobacteria bacterium]